MLTGQRLTWNQIREAFRGEWVELHDFKWDQNNPYPSMARVRHHAADRNELLELVEDAKPLTDSVILFVGVPQSVVHLDTVAASL